MGPQRRRSLLRDPPPWYIDSPPINGSTVSINLSTAATHGNISSIHRSSACIPDSLSSLCGARYGPAYLATLLLCDARYPPTTSLDTCAVLT
eukprot:3941619-Rhodomonas_salina.1